MFISVMFYILTTNYIKAIKGSKYEENNEQNVPTIKSSESYINKYSFLKSVKNRNGTMSHLQHSWYFGVLH